MNYILLFIRGNDLKTIPNTPYDILKFIYKHNLYKPIQYVYDKNVLLKEHNKQHVKLCLEKAMFYVMDCKVDDMWSILCISARAITHLVTNAEAGNVASAFNYKVKQYNGYDDHHDANSEVFWIINDKDLTQHINQHKTKPMYVSIFNQYPNSFTPYINEIQTENATVFHSIQCILNNLKLLDTFFLEWIENTEPVYNKTVDNIIRLEAGAKTARSKKRKNKDNTNLSTNIECYKSLIQEYALLLYKNREVYDKIFLSNCITDLLCNGFFSYTLMNIEKQDNEGTLPLDNEHVTIIDIYDQRINILLTNHQHILDFIKRNEYNRKVVQTGNSLIDILKDISHVDVPACINILESYSKIYDNLYQLYSTTSHIIPVHIPARVIIKDGVTQNSYAFDVNGKVLNLVFGQECTTLVRQAHSPFDIRSPITLVLNKFRVAKEMIQCIGLSYHFESRPLVGFTYDNTGQSPPIAELNELNKRHKIFSTSRIDDSVNLLKFDNKINHMYIDQELAKRRCVQTFNKIADKKTKEFTENISANNEKILAKVTKDYDTIINQRRRNNDVGIFTDSLDTNATQQELEMLNRSVAEELTKTLSTATQDAIDKLTSQFQKATDHYQNSNSGLKNIVNLDGGGDDGNGEENQSRYDKMELSNYHTLIRKITIERSINNVTEHFLYYLAQQSSVHPNLVQFIDRFHTLITINNTENSQMVETQLASIYEDITGMINGKVNIFDGYSSTTRDDDRKHIPIQNRSECKQCTINYIFDRQNILSTQTDNDQLKLKSMSLFSRDHNTARIEKLQTLNPSISSELINKSVHDTATCNKITNLCDHHDYKLDIKSVPSLSKQGGQSVVKFFIEDVNRDIVLAITGQQVVTNRQEVINTSTRHQYEPASSNRRKSNILPQSEEVVDRSISIINFVLNSVYGTPVDLSTMDIHKHTAPVNVYITKLTTKPPLNRKLDTNDIIFWQQFITKENKRDFIGKYLNIDKQHLDPDIICSIIKKGNINIMKNNNKPNKKRRRRDVSDDEFNDSRSEDDESNSE